MKNSITPPPQATVLLPIYNAEKYLEQAITSVLNQSFSDFELLLLNDGSKDKSADIIDYFVNADKRCRSFHWPNRGLITTLNVGLAEARGDIIFRMDADDACRRDRFLKQIQFLNQHQDYVAVGCKVMLIDPDGLPICAWPGDTDHEKIDAAHLAGKGGAIAHPSVAIRKEALITIGGYRAEFPHAEDIDLFLRLAEVGKLANLADFLLEYRQHLGSIGYRYTQEQHQSSMHAVAEAKLRRGLTQNIPLPIVEFPTPEKANLSDIHRKWGWWALAGGNIPTARKHALKALKKKPFDTENLKLLACTLRGY